MQSKAIDVDADLDKAPADRRDALERIRALCRSTFADADQVVDHGMAVCRRDGVRQVAFASRKGHIAVYGLGEENIARHEDAGR